MNRVFELNAYGETVDPADGRLKSLQAVKFDPSPFIGLRTFDELDLTAMA